MLQRTAARSGLPAVDAAVVAPLLRLPRFAADVAIYSSCVCFLSVVRLSVCLFPSESDCEFLTDIEKGMLQCLCGRRSFVWIVVQQCGE